jgi:methylphosphotriester-DNA--protein-cysteine methyltransferase
MIKHTDIGTSDLIHHVRQQQIVLAGNSKLKIYGQLNCKSGKRMKRGNRLFFVSQNEAIENGFRPCGHCMKIEYRKWICLNKSEPIKIQCPVF